MTYLIVHLVSFQRQCIEQKSQLLYNIWHIRTEFQFHNTYEGREIDCDLTSYDSCLLTWKTEGWHLTDSKETPMSPVFDRQWEGSIR